MTLIIFDISFKTLYVVFYALFHSTGYILLLYYSRSKKDNTLQLNDTNNYLFIINCCQILYLFFYCIEKKRVKSERETQKYEFFTETKIEDKLIIAKEVYDYSRDEILEKQLKYSCKAKTTIAIIFIYYIFVDCLYQKMLYFLLNAYSFLICDVFCSFYYSSYSPVIFLAISFSHKITFNNYIIEKHQKFSLVALILLGICYFINVYVGGVVEFNESFFLIKYKFFCIPVIILLQGWKFTYIKLLIEKYYLSIYLILGIKGLLSAGLDLILYFLSFNFSFFKKTDKAYYLFNIGEITHLKYSIPSIIILVTERFFMMKTISTFNSLYAASSQKISESMICLYELFYFWIGKKEYGYQNREKIVLIIMLILFLLMILMNLVFSEIIILNFCGLGNQTYYFLLPKSYKERISHNSNISNENNNGGDSSRGNNSLIHNINQSIQEGSEGNNFTEKFGSLDLDKGISF